MVAPRPRLYLDIDGCVSAELIHVLWAGSHSRVVTLDTAGVKHRVRATWSDELTRELEKLVTDFNLDVVFNSTWNENNDALRVFVPLIGGLWDARSFEYVDGGNDGAGWWKQDNILADQAAEPGPFIWVDDHEVGNHGHTVLLETIGTPALTLAPDQQFGLTRTHVAQMREFLEQL